MLNAQNAKKNMKSKKYVQVNRHMIMYPDLSVAKRLYGGRMLSWIDESAAMYVRDIITSYDIVTKKISEVDFIRPGLLGDVVLFKCKTLKEGRTSITVDCIAEVDGNALCQCSMVFVALGEDDRPCIWNEKYED